MRIAPPATLGTVDGPGLAKSPAPTGPDGALVRDGPPSSESLPAVMTVDELAALLRVNRKTLYAAFRAGELPGGRRIGGTIRFSRDAVLRWLAEGQPARPMRAAR